MQVISLASRLRHILHSSLHSLQHSLLITLKTSSTYLCCTFYIGLALERPTVLGFVFCLIVFAGSLNPKLVFQRGTPIILTYTILYAAVRYVYSMLISLDGSLSLNETGEEIGLSGMDPFNYGWFPASCSVFIIFTLAFIIKIHGIKARDPSGDDASGERKQKKKQVSLAQHTIKKEPLVQKSNAMDQPV